MKKIIGITVIMLLACAMSASALTLMSTNKDWERASMYERNALARDLSNTYGQTPSFWYAVIDKGVREERQANYLKWYIEDIVPQLEGITWERVSGVGPRAKR
jgi:3-methyladenine DNA glycosylase AlkC